MTVNSIETAHSLGLRLISLLMFILLVGCAAEGSVPVTSGSPAATDAPTSAQSAVPEVVTAVRPNEQVAGEACPVTAPVLVTPADDAAVMGTPAPGYYYLNDDRSIWASAAPPGMEGISRWQAGENGNKVGWYRPAGAKLEVQGKRLDGSAPPMKADVPCCYPTQFQASGLTFPTPGCWEITAKAEGKAIRFVVTVEE